ncbi:MAG: hypothetical protein ACYTFA_06985 [Planctomycetota bacterium]
MNFRKLRKKLAEYGIEWDPSVGKGSHGAFVGLSRRTRLREVYVPPESQQKDVAAKYIKPLRRAFELLPEYGVSDEELFS